MTKNTAELAASVVPKADFIQSGTAEKSSVKLATSRPVTGWDKVTVKCYQIKDNPNEWNMKDLQRYVRHLYYERYGANLHIPIAIGHTWINAIKFAILKKTGKETDHLTLKEYFDFCFAKHVDAIIKSEGNFSLYKITKPRYIIDFCEHVKFATKKTLDYSNTANSAILCDNMSSLTIADLSSSYRINSSHMVINYGFIIPVNYLYCVKNKSMNESISYVKDAVSKISQKEIQMATEATLTFQPYPKWLPFVDSKIFSVDIIIADNNEVFAQLKNHIRR